jgi:hypothetical protein
MRRSLIILASAMEELRAAALYYNDQKPGLGLELLNEWDRALIRIQRTPEGFGRKRKNFRQAMLERFPYLIIFEVELTQITVYKFINVRRHPKKRYTKRKK